MVCLLCGLIKITMSSHIRTRLFLYFPRQRCRRQTVVFHILVVAASSFSFCRKTHTHTRARARTRARTHTQRLHHQSVHCIITRSSAIDRQCALNHDATESAPIVSGVMSPVSYTNRRRSSCVYHLHTTCRHVTWKRLTCCKYSITCQDGKVT